MKKSIGFAGKILFYALSGALLVLMASYTMSFVGKLFPGDWIKQWGSLAIFDVGAIVWFVIFLTVAEGSGQRGTSLIGGVLDLAGGIILAGAEVFGAGGGGGEVAAWLQETATWLLFIWLGVNIALTWIYHVSDPHQQQAMKARSIQDDVTAKALDMAGAKVNEVAPQLADKISERMFYDILSELNVDAPAGRPVIEAKARDPQPRAKDRVMERWAMRKRQAQPAPTDNGSSSDSNPT